MNKILRIALVAAFGFMAADSMRAQVERAGQPTTLDATWTEVQKPSATSDGDLHLAGPSTINFTVKSRSEYWKVVLEVRSASGAVKGKKYYRYTKPSILESLRWQVSDDGRSWTDIPASAIHDDSTDGSIEVANGETGDYLYMGLEGLFSFGEVILTRLTSTTLRYDLYDDVPLFGTDTGTDNIQSNRIKDHQQAIDVYVHRNIAGNGAWSTLCLPFALTDFAVRKAFGDDIVYAEFDHVDLAENQIHFASVKTGMKAGTPYLIKNNSAAVDNFFADDVTFTQNGVRTINANGRKSEKEDQGYYYVGLLQPTKANGGEDATFNPDNRAVYIANPDADGNQKLKRLSSTGTLKAFRAYLCFPATDEDLASSESKKMISLDDAITGIGNVLVDGKPVNNNIYNLNGQMVGTDDTVLPHGIYVRNGKKFVVK